MPTWESLADGATTALEAAFGETVSYSRSASQTLDALAEFEVTAIPRLGLEFQGHTSASHALDVVVADISGGPQRGDVVVWQEVTYTVQAVEPPTGPYPDGTATLLIRRIR